MDGSEGRVMILPRSHWPLALRDFLIERSTVSESDIAYGALRSPGGYHPPADTMVWIRQALASLRWRQGKGSIWRKPAKA
jgi:hypothetical protein